MSCARARAISLGGNFTRRTEHDVGGDVDKLLRVARRSCGIDAELASILIGGGVGEHAVAKAAFFTHLLKQPRRHATAKQAGKHLKRIDFRLAISGRRK